MEELTHGGLFEGIGGFSIAARRCGIDTKWVCEINHYRKQILRQHFKDAHQYRDIRKLHTPPRVDIITGGFPCQNISVAGNGLGIIGEQSRLWAEYLRIIHHGRPRYVIIENSTQLRNKGLEIILHDLSKIGYDAQWQCLRATQFGYPHRRERLFVIAYSPEIRRRQTGYVPIFRSFTEIPGRAYRPVILPVPVKRIFPRRNPHDVSVNYGLPSGLDKNQISAIGDAVIPDIAEYLFRCVLHHFKNLNDK